MSGGFFKDNLTSGADLLEEQARSAANRAEAAKVAAEAAAVSATAASTSAISNLGLTGYAFSLSGVSTGDLIHWDGTNLSPLGQANVTDGGNF